MQGREEGFTLVELSIVLVIIGLLIGGILVAQSMISTSKIVAQVAQLQQFDAGVENFKMKYNYLPGDAPQFGGNGDGLIDYSVAGISYVSAFACDHAKFWNNIDPTQFPGGVDTCGVPHGVQITTSGLLKNVPLSKIGKPDSFIYASAIASPGGELPNTTTPQNYYILADPSQGQSIAVNWYRVFPTTSTNSAVKPSELLALDAKMDDGIANSGNVLSGRINNYSGTGQYGGPDSTPLGTCSSGVKYIVANSGYECTPLIRIGAQAGDPQ